MKQSNPLLNLLPSLRAEGAAIQFLRWPLNGVMGWIASLPLAMTHTNP